MKIAEVRRDDHLCASHHSRCNDVAILVVVSQTDNQRHVTRRHRFGKILLHHRSEASGVGGRHHSSRDEIALHLVEDLGAPTQRVEPPAAARRTVSLSVSGKSTFASTTTMKGAGTMNPGLGST